MRYQLEKFRQELKKLNIDLTEEQTEQFLDYYEFLIETNKVMNLTAITDFDEVIEKHFLDSLSLCRVFELNRQIRVIDMGTGAGFPGIPLKIAFPQIDLLLVDSLNKRIKFLREATKRLSLENVAALHARAEEIAKDKQYREQFDLCVSRAVANLSTLSEYCIPFVKEGGMFISYKSGDIEEEVSAAEKAVAVLGGNINQVYRFELGEQKRSFVMIEKQKKTPKAYPRKAGIPTRDPLR